jgi:hypothetical protein
MTQLAYKTIGEQKQLLTKNGGLCTTCCKVIPKVLYTVVMNPLDTISGTPIIDMESSGYWAEGVAIGYTHWRIYMKPKAYPAGSPPWNPDYFIWENQGYYRSLIPNPLTSRYTVGSSSAGTIASTGQLIGLQKYLCSFVLQYEYSGGPGVYLSAEIKLCLSPNGTDWPTL